ncbi:DNA-protecting protein DprA [Enterobacteriaceae bacterium ESL0689]|nr:DNA-protecting protein DprA [Enterobacteriaceae bacterium ESL0689]
MTSTEIWLRLMKVNNLYGDTMMLVAKRLCGVPVIDSETLHACGLSVAQSKQFLNHSQKEIDDTIAWLEHADHTLLLADDPLYPPQLRAITDYPGAILVWGDVSILSSVQVAIVGSRVHSWYGAHWGQQFSATLARDGITITSGLAIGIDGVAHRGALEAKGKTIAVLGNGLNSVYPRRHTTLAKQVVESGGALLSEFSLVTPPLPGNFPRRNRIISGLSVGVLVIEAALKSGSLVTVRCALEQGRDIFALPGPIASPGSAGPHWLMKQGAIPVTSAEDIIEYYQPALRRRHDLPDRKRYQQSSPAELRSPVLAGVGDEVTSVDVIAERVGLPVSVVVAQLLELELSGQVMAVSGGYVRLRRASYVP